MDHKDKCRSFIASRIKKTNRCLVYKIEFYEEQNLFLTEPGTLIEMPHYVQKSFGFREFVVLLGEMCLNVCNICRSEKKYSPKEMMLFRKYCDLLFRDNCRFTNWVVFQLPIESKKLAIDFLQDIAHYTEKQNFASVNKNSAFIADMVGIPSWEYYGKIIATLIEKLKKQNEPWAYLSNTGTSSFLFKQGVRKC